MSGITLWSARLVVNSLPGTFWISKSVTSGRNDLIRATPEAPTVPTAGAKDDSEWPRESPGHDKFDFGTPKMSKKQKK